MRYLEIFFLATIGIIHLTIYVELDTTSRKRINFLLYSGSAVLARQLILNYLSPAFHSISEEEK